MKILKRILIVLLTVIILVSGSFLIYAGNYYKAEGSLESVTVEDRGISAGDDKAEAGLIIYPGAKVEYTAYACLAEACAEKGIFTVCVKMPFNFAFMDIDAAEEVVKAHPEVDRWYMAGHSLGGAMAASYIAEKSDEYDGLILLASFSTADLSESGLKVLSIYGSNDEVLSMDSYERNRNNLPEGFEEVIIEGGCHAFFGNYGEQKGDGKPAITREDQIETTSDAIADFINGDK